MRVQAQVCITQEMLDELQPHSMEVVKADLRHKLGVECEKILDLEEGTPVTDDSKLFFYDIFLIKRKDFIEINETLRQLEFLPTSGTNEGLLNKVIALLRK